MKVLTNFDQLPFFGGNGTQNKKNIIRVILLPSGMRIVFFYYFFGFRCRPEGLRSLFRSHELLQFLRSGLIVRSTPTLFGIVRFPFSPLTRIFLRGPFSIFGRTLRMSGRGGLVPHLPIVRPRPPDATVDSRTLFVFFLAVETVARHGTLLVVVRTRRDFLLSRWVPQYFYLGAPFLEVNCFSLLFPRFLTPFHGQGPEESQLPS